MKMIQQNNLCKNNQDHDTFSNQTVTKPPVPAVHSRRVYTAGEIQQMLGIGKNETYRLIHSRVFPSIRIGHRIVIPKEAFHRWLNGGS